MAGVNIEEVLAGMAHWQKLELGTDQPILERASDYVKEAIELLNQHNPEAAIKKATEAVSLCDVIEGAKGPAIAEVLKELEEETLYKGGVLMALSQIVIADSHYQIGISGCNEETKRLGPGGKKKLEKAVSHYQKALGAFFVASNLTQISESFMNPLKPERAEIREPLLEKIYGGLANTYLALGVNAYALGVQLIERAETNGPDNLNKTGVARGLVCWGEAIRNFALVDEMQTAAEQNKINMGSIGRKDVMEAVKGDVGQIYNEGVRLANAIGRPGLMDDYLKPR